MKKLVIILVIALAAVKCHHVSPYYYEVQRCGKEIKANPNNAEAYYQRGVAKNYLDDHIGAIRDFNKAIELEPYYADAFVSRGISKYFMGDYWGAIRDFNRALEINPEHGKAYYNRGLAHNKLELWEAACYDWSLAGELGVMRAYEVIRYYCKY